MKKLIMAVVFGALAHAGFGQETQTIEQQLMHGLDAIGGFWNAVAALWMTSALVIVGVAFLRDKLDR